MHGMKTPIMKSAEGVILHETNNVRFDSEESKNNSKNTNTINIAKIIYNYYIGIYED